LGISECLFCRTDGYPILGEQCDGNAESALVVV